MSLWVLGDTLHYENWACFTRSVEVDHFAAFIWGAFSNLTSESRSGIQRYEALVREPPQGSGRGRAPF